MHDAVMPRRLGGGEQGRVISARRSEPASIGTRDHDCEFRRLASAIAIGPPGHGTSYSAAAAGQAVRRNDPVHEARSPLPRLEAGAAQESVAWVCGEDLRQHETEISRGDADHDPVQRKVRAFDHATAMSAAANKADAATEACPFTAAITGFGPSHMRRRISTKGFGPPTGANSRRPVLQIRAHAERRVRRLRSGRYVRRRRRRITRPRRWGPSSLRGARTMGMRLAGSRGDKRRDSETS